MEDNKYFDKDNLIKVLNEFIEEVMQDNNIDGCNTVLGFIGGYQLSVSFERLSARELGEFIGDLKDYSAIKQDEALKPEYRTNIEDLNYLLEEY